MLGLAGLSGAMSWFCRNSLTVIFPALNQDLNLSSQDLSLLSSLFFYCFAGSQIPLGILFTKFGVRLVVSVGLGLAALGCLVFALAANVNWAFAGRVLTGMGTSVSTMGGLAIIATWFPIRRFAFLSGMSMAIAGAGSLLASSPWVLLTDALGWRNSMLGASLCLLLIAVGCALIMRASPRPVVGIQHFPLKKAVRHLLLSPRFWIMGLTTGSRYGVVGSLQAAWAGPLLIYGFGMSTINAAHILFLFAVSYMVGMPLLGWISDKLLTRKKVVCCGQALLALLTAGLLLWTPSAPVWTVALVFFLIPQLSACGNIIFAHARELAPPELAPTAITWTNVFPLLCGALFIQFTGMFLPADVSLMSHPQELNHLWLLCAVSVGLTSLAYFFFIPESPAMLELKGRKSGRV
jgi:MFS family permease